jgi:drug/metabolite transporter (DMT)-like permease
MRGVGWVLLAAVAFATVSVVAKDAYGSGSDPVPLLGARMLIAAVVLSAASVLIQAPVRRRCAELAPCALAGLAFAAAGLGEFEALARAPVATVVLLLFVAPAWIALASWIVRGEPLGWRRTGALAGIVAGLGLLVVTPRAHAPGLAAILPALGASVMSAVVFVCLEAAGNRVPARIAACVAAWVAATAVVPLDPGGVAQELTETPHGIAVGALTAVALLSLAEGAGRVSALTASAVICAEPVLAAALSWVLLDDPLTPPQLAGAAVVMVAVTALTAVSASGSPSPAATGRTKRRRSG